jgi:hypothetical protein
VHLHIISVVNIFCNIKCVKTYGCTESPPMFGVLNMFSAKLQHFSAKKDLHKRAQVVVKWAH